MRADRLLALLLLLQTKGILTARELSEELEVSERTVYRDIEALGTAGIPVYTERGPGGGYALLESYRTNLTGFTNDELRALFMLSIPAPLAQLGVSQELKAALLKLSAALPAARRIEEEQTRQRIYLDSSWWFQSEESLPCLNQIQQAVWQDRKLHLKYRSQFGAEIEQVFDPYGLVAKTNVWYLVYAWEDRIAAMRVSRILEAEILDESFLRPSGFSLASFWDAWCKEFEENRSEYRVEARVSPQLVPELSRYFGERTQEILAQASPADAEGWLTVALPFETFEAARDRILGFGRAIEVLKPEPLRKSVIDFAEQICAFYQERERGLLQPKERVSQ